MNSLTYPTLAPYIAVKDPAKAIEYYKAAFGAEERVRLTDPQSGTISHAELMIGDDLLMLSAEFPSHGKSPSPLGGHTGRLCLTVDDVDAAVAKALAAGATVTSPAADHFYGFRGAGVRDPSGHEWSLQHLIEQLSPEEMQRRWKTMCEG